MRGFVVTPDSLPIDAAIRSQLNGIACDVSREEHSELERLLPGAAAKARAAASHWDFGAPANVIDDLLGNPHAFRHGAQAGAKERLRRVAVARLALRFLRVEDRLSDTVRSLYPDFIERLAQFLESRASYHYADDYFAKDIRYALGLTVPTGAHQVDLRARIGAKLILRDVVASRSAQSALAYIASRGWGRWYSNHIDLRAMKEFNPRGWTASFVRMADILVLNPHVRGIVGVSWFYDPTVPIISPHLAYIQAPMSHGAFLARMGSDSHHTTNATIRSSVRQKLYKDGKYHPTCYLLAWPRNALIAWARQLNADPSVSFGNTVSVPGGLPKQFVPVPSASAHPALVQHALAIGEKRPDVATACPAHESV